MKVSVNKGEGFKPVDIKITFETEQELINFKRLMQKDLTIPGIVCEHFNDVNEKLLSKQMGSIYDIIEKL